MRLATLVLGILLLTCAPAGAASWIAQPQIAAVGESPDLVSHRTVAAADGRVTQLIEQTTGSGTKTAVITRPPGGKFETIAGWDGGFSSIVDGPDGSIGVISHEWTGNDLSHAKAFVRVKRPGGTFDAKTELGTSGIQTTWPGFVAPDGTFWTLALDPASTDVVLLRRTADGTVKRDVVFDLLANEVVLAADLLRLPNGVARIAVSTRRDYQDNAASKCKRDTTLYVASADADGNGESGAIERATASEADGGFACAGVQHAYQDTGSVTLGPHVMAVSPSGITSIVYTGTSVQAGPKLVGAVVQLSLAPDKSWADGPKTETVVEAAMQPIGLAYAGETPVLLLLNSGGVLQSQRLDGAWTAPAFLGGQIPEVPSIVGSADGRALVALWTLPPAGSPISPNPIRAFVRQPDGKFDPGVVIDGATIFAGVWADGAGDLGVTLEDDADPGPAYTPVTYYRVYDGAGPKVTVTGPASGAADQSTGPFEATATDIWSAIPNPPSWSFSGGGDASGALVSHSFGAGGRQSATATFLDAAGNASSATTELDVAPAPVPDPSPSPTPVPTPTPTPTGKKDTTKPTVAKLKVAFDRRKRLATLKFTLSEDATVKLTIKTPGVKRATTITKKLKKGSRSVKTRRLRLHVRYTFALVATDAAKNTSKVATLSRRF